MALPRVIAWFSCGAASAVAAKMAIEKYGPLGHEVEVVYCDTSANEHPDNIRFSVDVSMWVGRPITLIGSEKYKTIEDVFEARKYISGPAGAPCTTELKKVPRFKYQRADDIHIFGLTADEPERIKRFSDNNPDMRLDWILRDKWITKQDCLSKIVAAGIDLPILYSLGYKNNNCIGCVKASSPNYWALVRRTFPDIFKRRAEQSREIGCRLVKVGTGRIFLDELPEDDFSQMEMDDISCGPECRGEQQ